MLPQTCTNLDRNALTTRDDGDRGVSALYEGSLRHLLLRWEQQHRVGIPLYMLKRFRPGWYAVLQRQLGMLSCCSPACCSTGRSDKGRTYRSTYRQQWSSSPTYARTA